MKDLKIVTISFEQDKLIPNNQKFPVVIYKNYCGSKIEIIETIFNQHNWLNSWTNGVFPYHHYHSNTHEVLGVIAGEAELKIGGETGENFHLAKGDVVILPAGTGHKRLSSSSDFKVVGAYPEGMSPNLRTEDRNNEKDREEIKGVLIPNQDPVFGHEGPLFDYWLNKGGKCKG